MVTLAAEGRTVLISSHQIAEIERIASQVAFISNGRLVLTATADEIKQRFQRFKLRFEGAAPDATRLGTVLERNGVGPLWTAVVRDPIPEAVAALRDADNIHDFEMASLTLEETYGFLASTPAEGDA